MGAEGLGAVAERVVEARGAAALADEVQRRREGHPVGRGIEARDAVGGTVDADQGQRDAVRRDVVAEQRAGRDGQRVVLGGQQRVVDRNRRRVIGRDIDLDVARGRRMAVRQRVVEARGAGEAGRRGEQDRPAVAAQHRSARRRAADTGQRERVAVRVEVVGPQLAHQNDDRVVFPGHEVIVDRRPAHRRSA